MLTGEYLITDAEANYMFDGSGNGISIPYDANDHLSTDAVPLWTVTGNNWSIVKEDREDYLCLADDGFTASSPKRINVDSNGNGFSLKGDGTGAYNLYVNGDKFAKTGDKSQTKLGIFKLNPLPNTFKCTFTYDAANAMCQVLKDDSPVELPLMTMSEEASDEQAVQSVAETTNSSGEIAAGEG